jgi:hypothetical protein
MKWLSLIYGSERILSETFKYRLRVDAYQEKHVDDTWWVMARQGNLDSATLSTVQKELNSNSMKPPRTKFAERIAAIETELMNGAMSSAALRTPSDFEDPEHFLLKRGHEMQAEVEASSKIDDHKGEHGRGDEENSNDSKARDNIDDSKMFDDGYSIIQPDEYVKFRLRPCLSNMRGEV